VMSQVIEDTLNPRRVRVFVVEGLLAVRWAGSREMGLGSEAKPEGALPGHGDTRDNHHMADDLP